MSARTRPPLVDAAWLRTMLIWLLIAAALAACAWSWMAWRAAADVTDTQTALLARYQDVVARQAAIDASVQAFGSYVTSGTPDAATQQLLTVVEQAARQTGAQLTGLKPLPSQRADTSVDYSVELDCSASMETLVRFLHALAYSPVLLRVNRLRINPDARNRQLLDAQMLVTYTTLL